MTGTKNDAGKSRLVAYVAGPYTAPTQDGVRANIEQAQQVALDCLREGIDPYTPHVSSFGIERGLSESEWLSLGLRWLERCDVVVLCPGLEKSRGTMAEVARAKELGIPVVEHPDLWEFVLGLGSQSSGAGDSSTDGGAA